MPASSRAHYKLSSVGRSVAGHTTQSVAGPIRFSELWGSRQACLTRVDLASRQGSVHDLGYRGRSTPRWKVMALGSIYGSQAGIRLWVVLDVLEVVVEVVLKVMEIVPKVLRGCGEGA